MSAWSWRKTADQVRLGCLYPIKHISKINFLRRVGELYTHTLRCRKKETQRRIFQHFLINPHSISCMDSPDALCPCRCWEWDGAGIGQVREQPGHVCLYSLRIDCARFSGSFSHSSRLDALWLSYTISALEYWPSPTASTEHSDLVLQPVFKWKLKLQRVVLKAGSFCSLGHATQMEMQIIGLQTTALSFVSHKHTPVHQSLCSA